MQRIRYEKTMGRRIIKEDTKISSFSDTSVYTENSKASINYL